MGIKGKGDPSPFLLEGGDIGIVLIHGLTGSAAEMRPIGEFLNARGVTVEARTKVSMTPVTMFAAKSPAIPEIMRKTVQEYRDNLQHEVGVTVIDMRAETDCEDGHIPGDVSVRGL